MSHSVLDEFGRRIIENVYNSTIDQWSALVSGRLKGDRADRIRNEFSTMLADNKLTGKFVSEIVQSTMHNLLQWIDEDVDVSVLLAAEGSGAVDVRDASDGLAGEIYTDRGWIYKYGRAVE